MSRIHLKTPYSAATAAFRLRLRRPSSARTKSRGFATKEGFETGFTLLELTITIGLLVLLVSMGLASLRATRNARELGAGAQSAMEALRLAQARTLAGENNSAWSVHLQQYKVVLFEGTDYAAATNKTDYPLPSSLEITGITLAGGGSDVVFKRVTGETDTGGSFVVDVASDPTVSFPVTIAPSGKVYRTASAPPPVTPRSVDMRHLSFNLGWSIKNGVTLTLTFSDPPAGDTIYNIAMAGFFNPGKTVFDWSGTYTIGGLDQVLRIHTTALTDTDTVLAIDRDCRKNSKKLTITINDGVAKTIATFEADCATVTVGPFGGTQIGP